MSSHLVAAIQMTSIENVDTNLAAARDLVTEAAGRGARLVVLPENFALLASGAEERKKFDFAELVPTPGSPADAPAGPIVGAMRELARKTGAWLVLGGMPEKIPGDPGHIYNACVVLDHEGAVRARYRKIHLFDVAIPGGAEFRESATVAPGGEPVVVDTPVGPLGLTVCYDVRFPELYRVLAARGARLVVVPAAFTAHTGKDHWHVLLRARAIENQCYVIAAAQFGRHNPQRTTYGHALIVDPWGTVVADAPDRPCAVVAEVSPDFQDKVRREMPCASHRRM
jgi:predicted amidohydrolase